MRQQGSISDRRDETKYVMLGVMWFIMTNTSVTLRHERHSASIIEHGRNKHENQTYLSCKLILLHTSKVGHLIEMDVRELSTLQYLGREFTSAIHN